MIDIPRELLFELLLYSLFCGALLGVFYDGIRAFKMLFGVRYGCYEAAASRGWRVIQFIVTFLTDVIFWVVLALVSIALIYSVGDGRFRGLTYIAIAIGFLIYYFTLGRLMLKISAWAVKVFKRAVKAALRVICIPVKWLLRLIISLYHLTIGKIIGKIKVAVDRERERKRLAAASFTEPEEDGGKEDLIYADRKGRYSKEGRISFGRRADR